MKCCETMRNFEEIVRKFRRNFEKNVIFYVLKCFETIKNFEEKY